MNYTVFDDYITLQSLLKTTGILHSGGAVKGFLEETIVLFNGERETRRGKKLRVGDTIEVPAEQLLIHLVAPSQEEKEEYQRDQAEKKRVAALVKQLNEQNKQATPKPNQKNKRTDKAPVRFPGT